jgi:beta-glucosidase-like glycosyl hydrolase/CubicO group peptidase (beta-lactamase class C family)
MRVKKRIQFISILSIFIYTTSAQVIPQLYRQADQAAMSRWVDSVYLTLTQEQKVGQLFMPIAEPNASWKSKISGYISNQKVGGLLFSKGILAEQAQITNYAQSLSEVPLLIAVDGEWGLSMRLTDAPHFPRNIIVGAITDDSLLTLYGKEVARQCREMGIHVNFAPSIDVHTNPDNPVIGTRSYGENPSNVARQGIAFARGLESNGVMAVAKHFPGHGDTTDDSHKTLPTIAHNRERLEEVELYPFREYVNAGLSGIMSGHLNVPHLKTKGLPASLSPAIGVNLLKEEMGFAGLTFTDGMNMKGVANQPEASVRALLAGNDVILGVSNQQKAFASVLDAVNNGTLPATLLEKKVRKILSYKYILGAHHFTPIRSSTIHQRVQTPRTGWLQRKIYNHATTLLKNQHALLPLQGLDTVRIASVALGASADNTFQQYLKKYSVVQTYQAKNAEKFLEENELKVHDLLIVSLHHSEAADSASLQKLIGDTPAIVVFFTLPYDTDRYKQVIGTAGAVMLAYDNTPFAQMSAAQGIFGGIALGGRLPVSTTLFPAGSGLNTPKTRLGYASPEEVGIASEYFSGIDPIAMEGIRQRAYPGCQILVAKDGVIIYEKEFGHYSYGHSPEVTDETLYDLASVTKVAATLPAVMKLFDEQKLALMDPIDKFVPETRRSDKAKIPLRSLLLHESGITSFIPYYTSAIDPDSYKGALFGKRSNTYHVRYAGAWGRTDYRFLPALISPDSSAQFPLPVAEKLYASKQMHDVLLRDVIASPLQKNRKYTYSCLNFMLLKEAVEQLTQTDLDSYVKAQFYRKLGAVTTTFQPLRYFSVDLISPTEDDPFFRKQHIRGYVHDEGAALFGGISGNAGLFSTAGDLAKLGQMWLNGGVYGGERLLSEETVKLFTTTRSSVSRRGLGFDKPDPGNSEASPTSPSTPVEVYGHTGFTGTSIWMDPTNNMIYIFLSNRVNPSRTPNRFSTLKIRERVQDEIYKALDANKQRQDSPL